MKDFFSPSDCLICYILNTYDRKLLSQSHVFAYFFVMQWFLKTLGSYCYLISPSHFSLLLFSVPAILVQE